MFKLLLYSFGKKVERVNRLRFFFSTIERDGRLYWDAVIQAWGVISKQNSEQKLVWLLGGIRCVAYRGRV